MSETTVHASSVAVAGRGLLIRGRSGAGKSSLALELMSRGATLVADDRTVVSLRDGQLWLDVPDAIRGMIEARGLGILNAQSAPASLAIVVDLDIEETERLPPVRTSTMLGMEVPLLHKSACPCFPAALIQYLRAGRRE
ncbi:HPr kinase/phosphorylase [Sagittula stellata]|uniref:Hpr serine kinase/phosphatase domain protein n=1 Tax=Sagittula stellata (strain ATCC 700073 / DSM 11524 / E-37) TaxID=388399 RepID=A3K985_SAGS3|nr:HPr kinase/phosphatase C-terminal domain-containing protein [Sagittula stellata]EBA06257.1 Hpr serine kinase/phosphatase domain protein [Sagittula stellata E-37]